MLVEYGNFDITRHRVIDKRNKLLDITACRFDWKKNEAINWLAFLMAGQQLFHSAYLKQAVSMALLNTFMKTLQTPNFLISLECCQNQMFSFFVIMVAAFLFEKRRCVEEKSVWNDRREWNKLFVELTFWLRIALCFQGVLDKKSRHSDSKILVIFLFIFIFFLRR